MVVVVSRAYYIDIVVFIGNGKIESFLKVRATVSKCLMLGICACKLTIGFQAIELDAKFSTFRCRGDPVRRS